ncbi:MAG: hypothetical protein IJ002_07250 [Clostridia bacterium]|nr:hypothetical protein [Clostridia bacterium]
MIKISFKKKKPKKKSFVRFSKKCLCAMIVLWFIAALVCAVVVAVQLIRGDMAVNTGDLVTCVGIPMTGGVIGYMIKSAVEDNTKKGTTYENVEREIDKP